jgi:outer membrane protein assembly complex protein YaeT
LAFLLAFSPLSHPSYSSIKAQISLPVIAEVRMTIDDQPASSEMLNLIPIEEGEVFSLKEITKSIKQIYKTGLFSDVRVLQDGTQMIQLTFLLTKKLYTRKITIIGKSEIPQSKLMDNLYAIRENGPFSEDNLDNAVEEIKNALSEQGFFQAEVEAVTEKNLETSQVDVSFIVHSTKRFTVEKIDFAGEPILPEEKLRREMRLKEGMEFVPSLLEEDLARLKKMYDDLDYRRAEVRVKDRIFNESEGEVSLVLEMNPQEKIDIVVRGAKVPMELLQPIWEARIFEEWGMAEGEAKIVRYLRKKGYIYASVESSIERDGNRMKIIHQVATGEKFRIKDVSFEGLDYFAPSQIKEALFIGQGFSLFRKIDGARLFELPREIEFFYKTHGFPETKVSLNFLREGKKLKPIFFIEEGKQERIESIAIEGESFINEQTLLDQITSVPGGPYFKPNIQKDIEKLDDYYLNQGIRGTDIEAVVQKVENDLYRLIFSINEGEKVQVEKVIITGNNVTKKRTIMREVVLKEGDFARLDAIRETKKRLEGLGVFTEVKIEEIPLAEGRENLLISVREGARNYASLGLGLETKNEPKTFSIWNNAVRPRGTAEFIRHNVFGLAAQASIVGQISFKEKRGVFSWEQPNLFGIPVETYLNAWMEREARKSFTYDRRGLSLTGIKSISKNENMVIISTMRFARTTLVELNVAESQVDRRFSPFSTTSIFGSYIWDNRDDPFNPTRGFFLSSALEWAYPYLKAKSEFVKTFNKFQHYMTFVPGLTFSSTIRLGLGRGRIPIHERFFGGGSNSFRGAEFDELGPKDPDSGKPVGGEAMILFNFELTFPLLANFPDLYGAVFYDKGNVFSRRKQVSLAGLQDALGLGLRYRTPLGPVRLEIGWNLDAPSGEKSVLGFITIGNVF